MSFNLADSVSFAELIDEISESEVMLRQQPPGRFQKNYRITAAAEQLRQQILNGGKDRPDFLELDAGSGLLPTKNNHVADEALALLKNVASNLHHLPVGFYSNMNCHGKRDYQRSIIILQGGTKRE